MAVLSAAVLLLASRALAGGLILEAYNGEGKPLDARGLLAFIGRADRARGGIPVPPVFVASADGMSGFQRGSLEEQDGKTVLSWLGPARVQFSLPWPVPEDGFSTVWADKRGVGYGDGEKLLLNEEIALSQHAAFKEFWDKRTKDWDPIYKPGSKAKKLVEDAREAIEEALRTEELPARARAFDSALGKVSAAWQKMLVEHGTQLANNQKLRDDLRFGLTLDHSLASAADGWKWAIEKAAKSGANWVRLVFRANPQDFAYAERRSFAAYDPMVEELEKRGLRVMGCVLETGQWPRELTPAVYADRARNLAVHYRGRIKSWEVGNEINGDWLGGPRTPLGLDKTFRIAAEAAAAVKAVEPSLETVATLYWWDGTAPDYEHSLFGWLKTFAARGFGKDIDVVALSLQPEDNPVGMAFDTIFHHLHEALPAQKLMVGNLGYVPEKEVQGYWWFDKGDVDGSRKDLLVLYNAAACATPRALCGGFWWQTLDQMILPRKKKVTDLYRVYQDSLDELGR